MKQIRRWIVPIAASLAVMTWAPVCAPAMGQTPAAQDTDATEIAKHVQELKSPDEKVRYDAVYALGEAGAAAAGATTNLIEMLKDTDSEVRSAAVLAIGKLGKISAANVAKIAALYKDSRSEVREAVADALGELTPPAAESLDPLFLALCDEEAEVRGSAVSSLGRIAGEEALLIPGITQRANALLKDSRPIARASSVQVLAGLPDTTPDVVLVLVSALADSDADVRSSAVQALGTAGPTVFKPSEAAALLLDKRSDVRAAAAELLAHYGTAAQACVPDLLIAIKDREPSVRTAAGFALKSVTPAGALSFPVLMELLASEDANLQTWAAGRLEDSPPARGSEAARQAAVGLTGLLKHERAEVRAAAAQVLGHIGLDALSAAPALVSALQDESAEVRTAAANSLGTGGLSATSYGSKVAALLKEPRANVRASAALAIERIGATSPSVVTSLFAALGDTDTGVRTAAFHALTTIQSGETPLFHPGLLDALQSDDPVIRRWASTSIETYAPPDAAGAAVVIRLTADRRPSVRLAAVELLGRLKLPADLYAPALIRALADDVRAVRVAAAVGLGTSEHPAKAYGLRVARLLLDPKPGVRASAAFALAQLDSVPAVSAGVLARLLHDDDKEVRRRAATALAHLSPISAPTAAAIEKALTDPYPAVRFHSVEALAHYSAPLSDPAPLLIRAMSDPDGGVRYAAVNAMTARPISATMIPAIAQGLRDREAAVRRASADALSGMSDALAKSPQTASKPARDAIARALEQAQQTVISLSPASLNLDIQEQTAEKLRIAIGAVRGEKPVRRGWEVGSYRGATALRPTPSDSEDDNEVRRYLRDLASTDAGVQRHAAYALGELGPAAGGASGALIAALKDKTPAVRSGAACALGCLLLSDTAAVGPLTAALADTDPAVREQAAFALGRQTELGGSDITVIASLLDDPRSFVRAAAARALSFTARRGSDTVVKLVAALRDTDAAVRTEAAQAIRTIGSTESSTLEALRLQEKDPSPAVRAAVAKALPGSDAGYRVSDLLAMLTDPEPEVRAEAYRGLTRQDSVVRQGWSDQTTFGQTTMAPLLTGLKDPDRRVREAAAEGLELVADWLASPQFRQVGGRMPGMGRGGGGAFRGPAIVRGPGRTSPQMDSVLRDSLETALATLQSLPEGALEDSARVELTPLRIRQALGMFKTLR